MLKFYFKVFYVMGKALSEELSCSCDRSCFPIGTQGKLLVFGVSILKHTKLKCQNMVMIYIMAKLHWEQISCLPVQTSSVNTSASFQST